MSSAPAAGIVPGARRGQRGAGGNPVAVGSAERLRVTLLFALVIHAVIALGVTFNFEKPAPSLKLSAAGHNVADGAEPAGLLPTDSLALAGAHACITPQPVVVLPGVATPAAAAGSKAASPAEGTAQAALDDAPLASKGLAEHDPTAADACTPKAAPSAGEAQHHSHMLGAQDGLSLDEWPAILQHSSAPHHMGSSPRAGAHAEPRRPGHQRKRSWAAVALGGPASPRTSGAAAEGLHACNGHADGVLAEENGVLAEAEPRFVPSLLDIAL